MATAQQLTTYQTRLSLALGISGLTHETIAWLAYLRSLEQAPQITQQNAIRAVLHYHETMPSMMVRYAREFNTILTSE